MACFRKSKLVPYFLSILKSCHCWKANDALFFGFSASIKMKLMTKSVGIKTASLLANAPEDQ